MSVLTINGIKFVPRQKCPLCQSLKHESYIPFPDIAILRCRSCGFLFSDRLMADDTLDEYYKERFGSERHRKGQLVNAKVNAWAVSHLLDINTVHNFLDVGTGYGFLIKELKDRFGLQTTGVELSEQEATYGSTHLNVDVRNCSLSESGLEPASFDVVACFEVIEHIADPGAFIDTMIHLMKPGGQLLIMTDNFESKVVKNLGPGFPKWIPHAHISHFGPGTLQRLFENKGLQITDRLSYTPWELLARSAYYKSFGISHSPERSFNLVEMLGSEMHGTFRLFPIRQMLNTLWAKISARGDLNGALMYVVARRFATSQQQQPRQQQHGQLYVNREKPLGMVGNRQHRCGGAKDVQNLW